jgi:hypothetical protein
MNNLNHPTDTRGADSAQRKVRRDYHEQLKDPLWQRKRLEKMQEAGWKCEICGDGSEELNIHHLEYNGKQAWEYDTTGLECLCRTCHSLMHMDINKVKAHAERLCVKHKIVRFIERPLRLLPKTKTMPLWCDEDGMRQLMKLQREVRLEYKAFEQSIKDRKDALCNAIYMRTSKAPNTQDRRPAGFDSATCSDSTNNQ